MYVYTENLAMVKRIKLDYTDGNSYCTAFVCVDDKYLITASYTGLRVLDTDGKEIHKICSEEFNALSVHNHKLYAYKDNINKLLIFQQTGDTFWKPSGEVYLNYNGDNKHQISSFHMENEQIYITDGTSIYHLDINGKLKRKISHGKDNRVFKNPRICSQDSQGKILVEEPKKLTVVKADGKCVELMLNRGEDLHEISDVCMGDDNECLWVAHYEADEDMCNSYMT